MLCTSVPLPATHAVDGSASAPRSVHFAGGGVSIHLISIYSKKTFAHFTSLAHSRKHASSVVPVAAFAYPSSALQLAFFPARGAQTPSENPPNARTSPFAIGTAHVAASAGAKSCVPVELYASKSYGFVPINAVGREERSTVMVCAAPGLKSIKHASPCGPMLSCLRYASAPPATGGPGVGPFFFTHVAKEESE
jgi:hypothetical protein